MTSVESFATSFRLRMTRDAYNRRICVGRGESLIAEHGSSRLSVLILERSARRWNRRRDLCVAAGCRLEQDGDTEGNLSFDPSNHAACEAAIRAAGCKRRRVATEAQRAALREHGQRFTARGYKPPPGVRIDDRPDTVHLSVPESEQRA